MLLSFMYKQSFSFLCNVVFQISFFFLLILCYYLHCIFTLHLCFNWLRLNFVWVEMGTLQAEKQIKFMTCPFLSELLLCYCTI